MQCLYIFSLFLIIGEQDRVASKEASLKNYVIFCKIKFGVYKNVVPKKLVVNLLNPNVESK